jgi:hypothetical protein
VRVCTREGIVAAARAGVEGGAKRVPIVTCSMLHITEPAPSAEIRVCHSRAGRREGFPEAAESRFGANSAHFRRILPAPCLSFLIMEISRRSPWREEEGSTDGWLGSSGSAAR